MNTNEENIEVKEDEQEEETSDSPSEETTEETQEEESKEESTEENSSSQEDFHKKELERLEKEKGQVQHNLDKAIKEKTAYKKQLEAYETESTDDDEDPDEKLRALVREEMEGVKAYIAASQSDALIGKYARNDSEKQLIQYHLQNTIRTSGNLEEDIKRAQILANPNRSIQTAEEIERAKAAKNSVSKTASSGQKGFQGKERPKLAEADEKVIRFSKAKWDSKKGVFKFPSGREWVPGQ